MEIAEIRDAVHGRLLPGESSRFVTGVSTDSRTTGKDELFVALRGEKFDGHAFVGTVVKTGAAAVIVDERGLPQEPTGETAVILVRDTLTALGDLARHYRSLFGVTVVAVSGSNGKTTTKEMISHLLAGHGNVVSSPKSFNNFVGLPLTLFSLEDNTDYAVVEVGTNHPGELTRLAGIADADVAVLTNIGPVHLEGFKRIEGVAAAKAELIEALTTEDLAVLNADDEWSMKIRSRTPARVMTYGLTDQADVRGADVRVDFKGITFVGPQKTRIHVPVLGRHNVHNALAAIGVARRSGMTMQQIAEGLATFRSPHMRLELLNVEGVTVLNDSYNANPVSMRAAVEAFSLLPVTGKTHVVLADMRELGETAEQAHYDLGRDLAGRGFDHLWLVGPLMENGARAARSVAGLLTRVHHVQRLEELTDVLPTQVRAGDAVLVKGSRAMAAERVIEMLQPVLSRVRKE